MYVVRLIEQKDIKSILPLLSELNPTIELHILEARLEDMINNNYECVGAYDEAKLVGISGLWILTKYYVGKHIELDNVYVLPEYQGKGIGKLLVDWILDYGKSKGCIASELNCYVDNTKGLEFWKAKGYETIGYHLARKI